MFEETGVRIPMSSASFAMRFVPVLMPTCAKTELSEKAVAWASVVTPAYASS